MEANSQVIPLTYLNALHTLPEQERITLNTNPKVWLHLPEGTVGEHGFFHALAILNSPLYEYENSQALSMDWPRIPVPKTLEQLQASAELGRQVAALLDQTAEFKPVLEVRSLGEIKTVSGKTPTPKDQEVSVRWGNLVNGAVMPGRGKTEDIEGTFDTRLGKKGLKVYLSPNLYLDNVPLSVWEYQLGGYQVLKKWLSYREFSVLGRALEVAEIRELRATMQRIASLLLLADELDANYRRITAQAPAEAQGEMAEGA